MAKILVVDDERDVAQLMRMLLERDGHAVTEAHNGEEALQKVGLLPPPDGAPALTPDLIILDVMMPVMDGYTVCARLREDDRTRAIPLIILTARSEMKDAFEMEPNVASYISKPFDPKLLRDLVTGMLAKA